MTLTRTFIILSTLLAFSCSKKESAPADDKAPATPETDTERAPEVAEPTVAEPEPVAPPMVNSFADMTVIDAKLSEQAGSLKKVKLAKDLQRVSFGDLAFVNDTLGFATGNYNTMIKTEDGGKSWKTVETSPSNARSTYGNLVFTSETEGLVPVGGNLKRTKDGGASWEFHSPGLELKKIFFADKDNGWATVPFRGLARSTDGGQTWKVVFTPSTSAFDDVYIGKDGIGWLMGHTSNKLGLWRSEDAGETWNKVFSLDGENDQTHGALGMTALSGDEIWLAGQRYLIASKDGGKSWTRYQGLWPKDAYFKDIVAKGEELWLTGFEVGAEAQAFLLHSTDGGANWAPVDTKLKPNNVLNKLKLHGDTLWVAGDGLFTLE